MRQLSEHYHNIQNLIFIEENIESIREQVSRLGPPRNKEDIENGTLLVDEHHFPFEVEKERVLANIFQSRREWEIFNVARMDSRVAWTQIETMREILWRSRVVLKDLLRGSHQSNWKDGQELLFEALKNKNPLEGWMIRFLGRLFNEKGENKSLSALRVASGVLPQEAAPVEDHPPIVTQVARELLTRDSHTSQLGVIQENLPNFQADIIHQVEQRLTAGRIAVEQENLNRAEMEFLGETQEVQKDRGEGGNKPRFAQSYIFNKEET